MATKSKLPRRIEDRFIEETGLASTDDGLPRIAGRIIGLLVVSEKPLDALSIEDRLQISHGSGSTNLRLLERLGLLERVSFPGDRRLYYRMVDDPGKAFFVGYRQRQLRLVDRFDALLDELKGDSVLRSRLTGMRRWHQMLANIAEEIPFRWDELRKEADRR